MLKCMHQTVTDIFTNSPNIITQILVTIIQILGDILHKEIFHPYMYRYVLLLQDITQLIMYADINWLSLETL